MNSTKYILGTTEMNDRLLYVVCLAETGKRVKGTDCYEAKRQQEAIEKVKELNS